MRQSLISQLSQNNSSSSATGEQDATPTDPEAQSPTNDDETAFTSDASVTSDVNATELFFQSRDQTHYWHFQTQSRSEHIALRDYYEHFTDLLDSFTECLQGITNERTSGTIVISIEDYSEGCIKTHFDQLKQAIGVIYTNVESHKELTAILDDMLILISKTTYLLTLKG